MYKANISDTGNAATEIAYVIDYLTLGFKINQTLLSQLYPIRSLIPNLRLKKLALLVRIQHN
jgi:hypothetical protein